MLQYRTVWRRHTITPTDGSSGRSGMSALDLAAIQWTHTPTLPGSVITLHRSKVSGRSTDRSIRARDVLAISQPLTSRLARRTDHRWVYTHKYTQMYVGTFYIHSSQYHCCIHKTSGDHATDMHSFPFSLESSKLYPNANATRDVHSSTVCLRPLTAACSSTYYCSVTVSS